MPKLNTYDDAGNLLSGDLLPLSRSPYTPGTFFTTTPEKITDFVDANAQLAAPSQVTGLAAALAAKLDLAGGTMTGELILAGNPTNANDAANKAYVDASAVGHVLPSCYASTTANLTATYNNGTAGVGATLTNSGTLAAFTADGTTPPINSLIFVPFQTSMLQNGLYTLTTVGSGAVAWVLTRATFYDQPSEIKPGDQVVIQNGATYTSSTWIQTATVTTVGTDSLSFTQTNILNAGTGLTKTGTTLSITNTAVIPGTYNDASKTTNATVNAQGQLISLALTPIAITTSQVTDFGTAAATVAAATISSKTNAAPGIAGVNSTYRIQFLNSAGATPGSIISTFVNANTAIREYAYNDRNGTIADDTDLALKEDKANKNALNGYVGLAQYKVQFGNLVDNSNTSFLTHANSAVRTYTFQDRTGTIADLTDIATKANTGGSNATGTWPISITGGSATVATVPALTGDITTSGSTNATTLKNTGTAGTYTKVTTDAQGRVSSGTTLSASDIPTLTASKISDFDTQVATTAELSAHKDATGGYAGLTLFKINFKNALNTFTSFFTNSNTAARTYTFQDRNGTIADDTDLALKANVLQTVNAQNSGSTYTVQTSDLFNVVRITTATDFAITLPTGVASEKWVDIEAKSVGDGNGTVTFSTAGTIVGISTLPPYPGTGYVRARVYSLGSDQWFIPNGTLGAQNYNNVNIGGGAISGTSIAGSTGSFTQITVPTSGGTPTALTFYQDATLSTTFTWSGFTSGAQSIRYQRIGKCVTVYIPSLSFTSTQNGTLNSVTALPSIFRPPADTYKNGYGTTSGAVSEFRVYVTTTGSIVFQNATGGTINGTSVVTNSLGITWLV